MKGGLNLNEMYSNVESIQDPYLNSISLRPDFSFKFTFFFFFDLQHVERLDAWKMLDRLILLSVVFCQSSATEDTEVNTQFIISQNGLWGDSKIEVRFCHMSVILSKPSGSFVAFQR